MFKKWVKSVPGLQWSQKRRLGSIQDCQTYLTFCKQNQVNLNSTVFNGTLYELYCKAILESTLYCKMMFRVGGSFDNGIDLLGKWELSRFYNYSVKNFPPKDTARIPSKSLVRQSKEYGEDSQGSYSLQNDIFVLGQCKNVSRNINAQLIREMAGLTKQALAQLNSTKLPIIHIKVSPLRYKVSSIDESGNSPEAGLSIYELDNWKSDGLQLVYLNSNSRSLLLGLNMEPQLQLVLKEKHIDV